MSFDRYSGNGSRQNLGTGCEIGKENGIRDRDGKSSGCAIVEKKGVTMRDQGPPFQSDEGCVFSFVRKLVLLWLITIPHRSPS